MKILEDLKLLLADFADWLAALVKQWAALVTGGVVVAVLYFLQSVFGHFEWASLKWLWLALLLAAFLSWRKERNTSLTTSAQTAALLAKPELTLRIERLTIDTNLQTNQIRSDPLVCVGISVGNEGFESAATQWEVWLRFDTIEVRAAPFAIGECSYVSEVSQIDAAQKSAHFAASFDFESLITNITVAPIKRGERRVGMFIGQVFGVSDISWDDLNTTEVRCVDFQRRVYTATLDGRRPEKGVVKVFDKQFGSPPPMGFRTPPIMPPERRHD